MCFALQKLEKSFVILAGVADFTTRQKIGQVLKRFIASAYGNRMVNLDRVPLFFVLRKLTSAVSTAPSVIFTFLHQLFDRYISHRFPSKMLKKRSIESCVTESVGTGSGACDFFLKASTTPDLAAQKCMGIDNLRITAITAAQKSSQVILRWFAGYDEKAVELMSNYLASQMVITQTGLCRNFLAMILLPFFEPSKLITSTTGSMSAGEVFTNHENRTTAVTKTKPCDPSTHSCDRTSNGKQFTESLSRQVMEVNSFVPSERKRFLSYNSISHVVRVLRTDGLVRPGVAFQRLFGPLPIITH
jgi:hypothetical protein